MPLSFMATALFALLAGCATTQTPESSNAPTTPVASSGLTGEQPWNLSFPDGCTLSGIRAVADRIDCNEIGRASVTGNPASQRLGRAVMALTMVQELSVGESYARLSTATASYKVEHRHWQPINARVRALIIATRIADRDALYATAPHCQRKGDVVILFDSCPGIGGDLDACGPPRLQCGAALASGENCNHNGACKSGRCGWRPGSCD